MHSPPAKWAFRRRDLRPYAVLLEPMKSVLASILDNKTELTNVVLLP